MTKRLSEFTKSNADSLQQQKALTQVCSDAEMKRDEERGKKEERREEEKNGKNRGEERRRRKRWHCV
jgi:hypothetical protein